ncbi:MAG: right-handed parallel beta-helix repeat-containing protein [Candidatus Binatia bacterium]
MKVRIKGLALGMCVALATLILSAGAHAAVTCSPRTPAAIAAPAAAGQECQDAIAKAGLKYIKYRLNQLAKCKLEAPVSSCPNAEFQIKLDKARIKAERAINKACGADTAQAGLSSSYSALTDDAVIASCMLSQHRVSADLMSAFAHGATTEAWPATGEERQECLTEVSKRATKFVGKAINTVNKCLADQAGQPGNLATVCVGSFDGTGVFVPPTDEKAGPKLTKLMAKIEKVLLKGCSAAEGLNQIATLFACPGAATVADLQECIICNGMTAMFDATEQQHAESGVYITNGPGAVQLAVGTGTVQAVAAAGTKFLLGPGNYNEEVTIFPGGDNIALVGCGAASNNRPRFNAVPPGPGVVGRGIQAAGVDGLLFQSLDFFNHDNDHIRVAQAEGVTFRDITGDGNSNTAYAVFPILSNNVLIELCKVRAQNDAPIYVGQSSGIITRFNDVRDGVAGIEIENCGNAQVYGNYGTDNTAGLLVFKDGNLPTQLSQCHDVHHNLFEDNNTPNFGSGSVGDVPTGTGILVISNDATPYSYNITRGNNTAGLVLTDQFTAGFNISAGDPTLDGNALVANWATGNATAPDPIRWPLPFSRDFVYLAGDPGGSSGNCENGNIFATELGFGTFASVTPPNNNAGTCTLPLPAVFPTCPAPPIP